VKVTELKGKKVITVPGGENIGTVADVLLHSVEQHLGALIVTSPNFAGPQIVLAEDVSSFGGDVVAITGAEKLQEQARFGKPAGMVSVVDAAGRRVATASGKYAGELSDVHLDPATGKVSGYEVTGGLFARMFGRSHTIEASEHSRLGEDLLIVDDAVIPTEGVEEGPSLPPQYSQIGKGLPTAVGEAMPPSDAQV